MFILFGSKGILVKYGGFEVFIEKLIENQKSIQFNTCFRRRSIGRK